MRNIMNDMEERISEKKNVSKAAGIVGFYTLLSRILGLIRDIVVAGFFGAGMAADAFFVAFRIPNMLRRLFAEGSLTIAFIPIFTEYMRKRSREDAFELARVTLTLLSIILAIITIAGVIFSPWIVRILAWGFGGEGAKYELTVLLTRITFPYIFLVSIVAFFMGVLNTLKHFAAPAAAPVFLNLGIIAGTILISPYLKTPVIGTAIGVIIGGILQVGLQIPWVIKNGLSLMPRWMPAHPAVKRIGLLMVPAVFGSAIYQVNQFIGTLLASCLPEGSISWLYYADRLVELPLGVFAIAISTAALPSLAKQAVDNNLPEFSDTLNHAVRLTFFITIPAMMGLIVLGKPIVQLFFERGAFDALSTENTAFALVFYSAGLWAFSGNKIIVSAFYAVQDTLTPVKISIVTLLLYLIFGLILMGPLRHGGLALALSLSSSAQFVLLVILLKKKIKGWNLFTILQSAIKSIIATILMGIGVFILYAGLFPKESDSGVFYQTTYILGLVIAGIIIYFGAAKLLGCGELDSIVEILGSSYRKKQVFNKEG